MNHFSLLGRAIVALLVAVSGLVALPGGASAAPVNDNLASYTNLGVPGSASGSTSGATLQSGEPRP